MIGHNITEKILSNSQSRAEIELRIPASCDYFDGHFPVFKLLPAVGQFDIAVHSASELFGTSLFVTSARRMKFTRPVRPESTVRLVLEYDSEKSKISYSFSTEKGDLYSTGIFDVEKNAVDSQINKTQGFIVPVYRHGEAVVHVVEKLIKYNRPIIIIDDGNIGDEKKYIEKAASLSPLCTLIVRDKNNGKGKAVCDGIIKAHEMGLTHVLQIDADGQHDISKSEMFFEQSVLNPESIICGYPEYDKSVPAKRKNGRVFANVWIRIVACNFSIKDAMCGFRVYPVKSFYNFINKHNISPRMGFDIDILVRLSWRGVKIISCPVNVSYPEDGVSNFRMFRDNVAISLLFARLCLGMIVRLPFFAFRAMRNK